MKPGGKQNIPSSIFWHFTPAIAFIAILFIVCIHHEPQWKKDQVTAQRVLTRITSEHFDVLPREVRRDPVALAKRINAYVHGYCTCEAPIEPDARKLIVNCRTSCGGYVHVFRQIADHYDITTRMVYLFNIPLQGNHAMVEVLHHGNRWALFDPTFGTFFTTDGEPSSTPYSLDDLYYFCTPETIDSHVVQATERSDMLLPLHTLYARKSFSSTAMDAQTYLSAEAYGPFDAERYSLLWMDIDLMNNQYRFGGPVERTLDGERSLLALTNALLNDGVPGNHVSYDMSYLGSFSGHTYKNGYHLHNLKSGGTYRITFYGTSAAGASLYPHFTDTSAVLRHTGSHPVPKGAYACPVLFRARDTRADLILEVYPGTESYMRVFGVLVELWDHPGTAHLSESDATPKGAHPSHAP